MKGERRERVLDSLMASQAHRGPDHRGHYADEHALLAHLRLSIIDLSSAANQPMHSHCGRYVMVYNGEVYNYREIQRDIQQARPGFSPRTTSDSEIILEAFSIWHTRFVHKLNGMFAIAIWDRQLQALYLFRDRIGIKPLYCFTKEGSFAFASELKGLTACKEVFKELTLSAQAVNQYLHLGYIPAPHSIYTEVLKFPAGHYGVVHNGQLTLHPYWRLNDLAGKGPPITDPRQGMEELKELVESSVRYRLIADVPYGTFLSGGIDSSLVSAVAQSQHSQPVNTFSIGFWNEAYDESGHAREVARYLGTNHHEMHITREDALEWLPRLTHIYDEPYADSSAIPTLLVSQMARRHVTVTLSGDGGDELFMGYGAYNWAQRLSASYIPWVGKPAAWMLRYGPHKYRRAARMFENPGDDKLRSHIFSQEQYLFSRREVKQMLIAPWQCNFTLDEHSPHPGFEPAEEQALFDMKYYLPDDLLVKVDRASMHFGLETRVPLLDHRIVEKALNIHQNLKMHRGQSKWILKELLYSYAPKELFDRPKRGFAIPLQQWLGHELKDFTMDYLNPDAVKKGGLLDSHATEKLLHAYYGKKQDYLYNRVWQLLVLQKWKLSGRF